MFPEKSIISLDSIFKMKTPNWFNTHNYSVDGTTFDFMPISFELTVDLFMNTMQYCDNASH